MGPLEPVGSGGVVTHLQHVQQCGLSSIVEAEEQQLGVLVEQAERREDVVDCRGERRTIMSASCPHGWVEGRRKQRNIHQLIIHILADDARLRLCCCRCFLLWGWYKRRRQRGQIWVG